MVFLSTPATLAALCLSTLTRAANICFSPSGEQSNDVPCDPTAAISVCCRTTDACLPSGLCRDTTSNSTSAQVFIRATCTDSTWMSSTCPPYCVRDHMDTRPNGTASSNLRSNNTVYIRQCNIDSFEAQARFCCGFAAHDTECCNNSASLFQLSKPSSNGLADAQAAPKISPVPTWPTPSSRPPLTQSSNNPVAAAFAAPPTPSPPPAPPTPVSAPAATAVLAIENPDGTEVKAMTVTFGGTDDTLLLATDAPPMQLSNGPRASPTRVTNSASSSTSAHTIQASAADDPSLGSSTESAEYHRRLSRGAVVAVGIGLSLAGAGLVTMTVFIIARRRVYKKQEKKWREHMQAVQALNQDPGSSGGPGTNAGKEHAARAYGDSSISHASNAAFIASDANPAQSRLGTTQGGPPATKRPVPTIPRLRLELEGPSPVSVYLREMGWREGSRVSITGLDNGSHYSQDSLRADRDRGVVTHRSDIESPSARSPGLKPTASWLGRNSIYEMP